MAGAGRSETMTAYFPTHALASKVSPRNVARAPGSVSGLLVFRRQFCLTLVPFGPRARKADCTPKPRLA